MTTDKDMDTDADKRVYVPEGAVWTLRVTEKGKDDFEVETPRNLPKLQAVLLKRLEDTRLNDMDAVQVSVTVPGHPATGEGENEVINTGETVEVSLPGLTGPASSVVALIAKSVMTPEMAISTLRQTIAHLGEVSDMVGVMVNMVSESRGVGGFTVLNNKLDVTPESLILLAESASGQVETFKTVMQQQGIKFPSDSTIVTPGTPEFRAPSALTVLPPSPA